MLQGKHSAKLSTIIKLPFVVKILVSSMFEQQFYTGFTVLIIIIVLLKWCAVFTNYYVGNLFRIRFCN